MNMSLEEWDAKIKHHLDFIEAGMDIIERHVSQLWGQPDFLTLARADLDRIGAILVSALARVEQAKMKYDSLPVVS